MSIVPTCINYLPIVLPSLHTITTLHPRVLNYLLHNQTGIFSITQLEKNNTDTATVLKITYTVNYSTLQK